MTTEQWNAKRSARVERFGSRVQKREQLVTAPVPIPHTISRVLDLVATEYGLTVKQLMSIRRHRHLAHPRQVAMYLIRRIFPLMSLSSVGLALGRGDHTTALHAIRSVESRMKESPEFEDQVFLLEQEAGRRDPAELMALASA